MRNQGKNRGHGDLARSCVVVGFCWGESADFGSGAGEVGFWEGEREVPAAVLGACGSGVAGV